MWQEFEISAIFRFIILNVNVVSMFYIKAVLDVNIVSMF